MKSIKVIRAKLSRYSAFLSFSAIGLVNTAVDFFVFSVLVFLTVSYLPAQVGAYAAGVINSFILNSKFTFKQQKARDTSQQMIRGSKFLIWNFLMLLSSSGLLWIIVDLLQFNVWISKLIVTFLILVINYLGNKYWVFRVDSLNS